MCLPAAASKGGAAQRLGSCVTAGGHYGSPSLPFVAQIAAGVEGLIVGGTTGEGQLMSWDEHIMLIAHTANRFGSRIAVIGNTGSNATREAVHATCQGFAVGMDAALHINPYYGKTSRDGLIYHFSAVLDYGPTIVYNVPGRTGQDITPDVVHELAAHPNFAGVKECAGNDRIRGYTSRGLVCWSGNDDEAHDARYDAGAVGVISVTSNVVPGLMRKLLFDGPDPALRDKLAPFMRWLFVQPNPIGLNTALAMLARPPPIQALIAAVELRPQSSGRPCVRAGTSPWLRQQRRPSPTPPWLQGSAKPVFRLPYSPYSRELREEGARLMAALGQENLAGDVLQVLEAGDFKLLERY